MEIEYIGGSPEKDNIDETVIEFIKAINNSKLSKLVKATKVNRPVKKLLLKIHAKNNVNDSSSNI